VTEECLTSFVAISFAAHQLTKLVSDISASAKPLFVLARLLTTQDV
jgi:hypothetical protein